MSERKITPRYVEVTPKEALELFKTSNEEADAARSRLMAKYALRTGADVPVIGVVMGDQNGERVPARMVDLSSADLGTTLNPNKHFMPRPQQVEAKKAETIAGDAPEPVVENIEQAYSWPDKDLDDVQSSPLEVPLEESQENDRFVEPPQGVEEVVDTVGELPQTESPVEVPMITASEKSKDDDDPLALAKILTKELLHNPHAYMQNREALVHVLSGQYASELEGLRGGQVSDEILGDISFATAREAREIKSQIGRLDEVNEKASELLRDLNTDLRDRVENFNTLERDIKKSVDSYKGLVNTLTGIASSVEEMMRDFRLVPIRKSDVEKAYSTILHQKQVYEHYHEALFRKGAPDAEGLYASFRGPSLKFEDDISTVRRVRDQEETDTLLSTEEVADRVIGLGATSVGALQNRVDDKIEDTVRELNTKHEKVEEVVAALGGIRAEESLWDKSKFPDEEILSNRTAELISALDVYLRDPAPANLLTVKEKGGWLQREMLDEGSLRKARSAADSSDTLLQKLDVARDGINALQLEAQ